MKSLDTIAFEAMQLPSDQRLTLANRILTSVDADKDPSAEAAWDDAIRERIRQYDAGEIKAIPGVEVFRELDKKLAK